MQNVTLNADKEGGEGKLSTTCNEMLMISQLWSDITSVETNRRVGAVTVLSPVSCPVGKAVRV